MKSGGYLFKFHCIITISSPLIIMRRVDPYLISLISGVGCRLECSIGSFTYALQMYNNVDCHFINRSFLIWLLESVWESVVIVGLLE